jgi:hypothetical protein
MKTENVHKFKRKETAAAASKVAEKPAEGFEQTTEQLLEARDIRWEALDELRSDLAMETMKLVQGFDEIVNSPLSREMGEDQAVFDKFVSVFRKDIGNFSNELVATNQRHAGKSGKITTDAEYNKFMEISMAYESLYLNVASVTGPVITQLVLLLTTANQRLTAEARAKKDLADVSVVSDVDVKPIVEESQSNV